MTAVFICWAVAVTVWLSACLDRPRRVWRNDEHETDNEG